MKMDRRAFLGLAAAAVAHQATKDLAAETQPITVNFDDIRIGQWADYTGEFDFVVESESFYTASIHPFIVADLMADETIGSAMRQQFMRMQSSRFPISGEAI